MPDEPGSQPPIHEGDEPEGRGRGGADEEAAFVVFDEAWIRAAAFHEPTAVERLLAAAQARAAAREAEARRVRGRGAREDERSDDGLGPDDGFGQGLEPDDLDDTGLRAGRYGAAGPLGRGYGTGARWHRPVAWMLALVMGIGMVALAFTAVYRAGLSDRRDQVPAPAPTGLEQGQEASAGTAPSVSADSSPPVFSAVPRTP